MTQSDSNQADSNQADSNKAHSNPAEASPADPSPADPSLADPSRADVSPAEPSPADVSPAEPSPGEPSPGDLSLAEPSLGEIERIVAGQHHDPHSILGAHPGPDGVVIRALRPLATSVTLVVDDGRRFPMAHVHQGVFAVTLPDEKVPDYRIAA
jgi:hypothetical protein